METRKKDVKGLVQDTIDDSVSAGSFVRRRPAHSFLDLRIVISDADYGSPEASEQPSNESNPDIYKASLESIPLHVDQFNAVLLQLLSSCRSGHSRRASNGRFRNGVRGRGAKFARRQFTTLRRCISEALSTSHETIDGLAFMRLVLQHHPYYGKITMATAIVTRLSPDLVRSVASKDRRIVANVAMNMIKRWVSQASYTR
jgi:hypothetical protein